MGCVFEEICVIYILACDLKEDAEWAGVRGSLDASSILSQHKVEMSLLRDLPKLFFLC